MSNRPWTTTIISVGCLSGIGDVVAQQAVERRGFKNHDLRRTANFTAIGLVMVAPCMRAWYITLDRLVKGTGTTVAIKKMLLDQSLWAPTIIASIFAAVDLLEGKTMEQFKQKFDESYFTALKTNWCVWPFVQIFNFYFVPLQHRVIIVNVVAIFWNTYLAWITNAASATQNKKEE